MKELIEKQLINAYIEENDFEICQLSGGHINQSFLIKGKEEYVFQVLNRDLYEKHTDILISNYECYRKACDIRNADHDSWEYPVWLRDRGGEYLHRDKGGDIVRMYRYIPTDDPGDPSADPVIDQYEAGKGLGILHLILKNCKGIENIGTTAHLHDLSYHYGEYLKQDGSAKERVKDLDVLISKRIEGMLDIGVPTDSVIHGDAKISNMIVRKGMAAGFIDTDTIMKGSVFDDIADCARSCCLKADNGLDEIAFDKLIKGYEEGFGIPLKRDEVKLAKENIAKNRFMLGLRYYTDHLSGSRYFSEEYPGQSLKKACKLLLS